MRTMKSRAIAIMAMCVAVVAAIALAGCASSSTASSTASSTSTSTSTAASSPAVNNTTEEVSVWVPEKVENSVNPDATRTTSYLFEDGNLVALNTQISGAGESTSETTFVYEDGLIIAGESEGGQQEYVNEVNDAGQLVSSTVTTKSADDLTVNTITNWTYDADGNVIAKATSIEMEGSGSTSSSTQTIDYEDGLPVKVTTIQNGNDGMHETGIEITYGEKSDYKLTATIQAVVDGEAQPESTAELTLDEYGNITNVTNAAGNTVFSATYKKIENPGTYVKAAFNTTNEEWAVYSAEF